MLVPHAQAQINDMVLYQKLTQTGKKYWK